MSSDWDEELLNDRLRVKADMAVAGEDSRSRDVFSASVRAATSCCFAVLAKMASLEQRMSTISLSTADDNTNGKLQTKVKSHRSLFTLSTLADHGV